MHKNQHKIGTDLRNFTKKDRQRGQIKFTKAGYPIHDYIKEMREEREALEYKKAQVVKVDPEDLKR